MFRTRHSDVVVVFLPKYPTDNSISQICSAMTKYYIENALGRQHLIFDNIRQQIRIAGYSVSAKCSNS